MKKEVTPMDRQSGPVQMESNPPSTQGLQHVPTEPLAWAETAGRVIHYLMMDFAGGRRWFKLAWVINFQKLTGKNVFLFQASTSPFYGEYQGRLRVLK